MIIFVSGTYIISQEQMYKFVISDSVYIACDTSSAPVTLYMPKITQEFMTVKFYISDGSSNAASNNITILPNGADLINGGASIGITSNDGCCVLTTASTSDVNNIILSPQSIWIAASSQSGGGGITQAYQTVKDEGIALTQRSNINFIGSGVTATDNAVTGATDVTILGGATTPALPFKSIQFNNSGSFGGNAKYTFETSPIFNGNPAPANSLAIQLDSSNNSYTTQTIRSLNNGGSSLANLFMQNGVGTSGVQHGILVFNSAWSENPYLRNSGLYSTVLADTVPPNTSPAKQFFFIAASNSNSQFEWHYNTTNDLQASSRLMSLRVNGRLSLAKYGINTFAGTPTYSLGVDASGNVVEFVGGGGFTTADNGLTASTSTNVQLGGTLIQNTTINADTYLLDITGTNSIVFQVKNTSTGVAAYFESTTDNTIIAQSSGKAAIYGLTNGSNHSIQGLTKVNGNTVETLIKVARQIVSGSVGVGLGGAIDISLPATSSPVLPTSTIEMRAVWTSISPLDASWQLWTKTANVLTQKMEVFATGQLNLAKYGTVTPFTGTPTYLLGVNASGDVIETNVGGNANIQYILEANLLALELANNLDLNTIYVVTDTPNFMLMCKAETISKISNTATIVDAGVGSYSGSVNYVSRDSTIATRIGSIVINDDVSTGLPQDSNQWFCVMPSAWVLGVGCLRNTFYSSSSGTLGDNCFANIFQQSASLNTLGESCTYNTFEQEANTNELGNDCTYNTFEQNANANTLGVNCSGNTFEQMSNTNILGIGCQSNTFEQNASQNTLGDTCQNNTFGKKSNGNTLGNLCNSNIFEKGAGSNTLGDTCSSNTFEQSAGSNTLGGTCTSNTFEQGAGSNSLGILCAGNTFKKTSTSNTILDQCSYNVFGENSVGNSIGLSGTSNILGMLCSNNALLHNCISNIFEQEVYDNSLGSSCNYNTFEQGANTNTLGTSCAFNKFELGSNSNVLGDNCYYNTFRQVSNSIVLGNDCQYNTFGQGVNGFTFASNLLNVTVEGTALGLDLTPIGYAFIYSNSTPAVIRYDSANAQWYHQYYDTLTSAFITTNL